MLLLCSFSTENDPFTSMKDVAAFKAGITKMAASTNTIKASFKQEKYLSILSNKINSRGTMLFKKENQLRWEYNDPFQYIIILNGKQIIVKDQGKVNSMDIAGSQTFKQINELLINSVQGNILDESKFSIEYLEGKETFLTRLTPKEEQLKKYLNEIEVYFDRQDFSVSKVKLIENEGDYTLISFFNKKMNEPISDENFSVK